MTFPTQTTRRSLASALETAQSQAGALKSIIAANVAAMAAGNVTSSYLLQVLDRLIAAKAVFLASSSLSGIDTYAQEQLGSSVGADFTAMMAAIDTAGAWVVSNFPKQAGTGYLLAETFAADGRRIERTFTPADTADLRSLLSALIATID